MKKTFPLTHERHKPARVIDLTKSDIRKYIKRERKRTLPEDVDFLAFDCKFGFDSEEPVVMHESEFNKFIDQAVEKGCKTVYIEILGKPAVRLKKEVAEVVEKTVEVAEEAVDVAEEIDAQDGYSEIETDA